jgi:putative endonuclease
MEIVDRKAFGGEAEDLAVAYLEREGYTIRDRNVPCRVGELDVVAEKDGMLIIVEVRMKTTSESGDPSETVMGEKQRRVVKATLYYLQGQRIDDGQVDIRFDVIAVVGRGKGATIEHYVNAFDAGF